MSSIRLVNLFEFDGIGLILLISTGIMYSNQTGGLTTRHPRVEGCFVPLSDRSGELVRQLTDHFTGTKWRGYCDHGIDSETADLLDHLLDEWRPAFEFPITVDRTRMAESQEAWVYVNVAAPPPDQQVPILEGLTPCGAVLTWLNSD
jgi:Family of unknown function (DUF6210)